MSRLAVADRNAIEQFQNRHIARVVLPTMVRAAHRGIQSFLSGTRVVPAMFHWDGRTSTQQGPGATFNGTRVSIPRGSFTGDTTSLRTIIIGDITSALANVQFGVRMGTKGMRNAPAAGTQWNWLGNAVAGAMANLWMGWSDNWSFPLPRSLPWEPTDIVFAPWQVSAHRHGIWLTPSSGVEVRVGVWGDNRLNTEQAIEATLTPLLNDPEAIRVRDWAGPANWSFLWMRFSALVNAMVTTWVDNTDSLIRFRADGHTQHRNGPPPYFAKGSVGGESALDPSTFRMISNDFLVIGL